LKKSLNVFDLTALGIAAVIGAGIFSTIGNAAVNGGPAVSLLFLFTAMACAFSALCYAQFASVIPISGSAYTYAYASFGETHRLDHRLGPDHGICHRQHCRGNYRGQIILPGSSVVWEFMCLPTWELTIFQQPGGITMLCSN